MDENPFELIYAMAMFALPGLAGAFFLYRARLRKPSMPLELLLSVMGAAAFSFMPALILILVDPHWLPDSTGPLLIPVRVALSGTIFVISFLVLLGLRAWRNRREAERLPELGLKRPVGSRFKQ